jgi:ADP-heptose:LPS heptosyltransferase
VTSILILKTGALGDVLRTTSILPGLHERYADCRVTWVTAPGAVDLVRLHPLVREVIPLDDLKPAQWEAVHARLSLTTWDRVLSFDDEESLCRLASSVPSKRISGAFLRKSGLRAYTPDVAPWFDMGLLSVHGKAVADRRKLENRRTHPAIFAEMLGIAAGKPKLPREPASERFADGFARRTALCDGGGVIGLNTGAGGRWQSKTLPVERTIELAASTSRALGGSATFLLLGGKDEAERNRAIADGLKGRVRLVDGGTQNPLFDFAALISRCSVLVTSDSLALHVALARDVRVVVFFAPTSPAEIELYGLGEKVVSTAPDACTYLPDVDTSTLTVERLQEAVLRQLALAGP